MKIISQADIDEMASWFYCNSGSINFVPWAKAADHCKRRWRVFAKRLLTKMPPVVVRHAKEAS